MGIRRVIRRRVRHEGTPRDRKGSRDKLGQEGLTRRPDERSATEAPLQEWVEEGADEPSNRLLLGRSDARSAPIDRNVIGELNAALPEDHENEGTEETLG
jgi:hypothetical protein